jgi:hypothetical protein
MVFVEGDDYRALRRPGDNPAQFRSPVRLPRLPASIEHQYKAENFTATQWPDSIGNADMSVSGLSQKTRNGEEIVNSDGIDDIGKADGPQDIPRSETYAVALTISTNDATDQTSVFGVTDGNNFFRMNDSDFFDRTTGELVLALRDSNKNQLALETQSKFFDGNSHVIVWNKRGNTSQDVNLYVDDMTAPVTLATREDQGFDHTAYNPTDSLGFFAENFNQNNSRFKEIDIGFIEFYSEPLSVKERIDAKRRAQII